MYWETLQFWIHDQSSRQILFPLRKKFQQREAKNFCLFGCADAFKTIGQMEHGRQPVVTEWPVNGKTLKFPHYHE